MLPGKTKGKTPLRVLLMSLTALAVLIVVSSVSVLAATDPCHPENDKPKGAPLTAAQLKSCEDCNNNPDLQKCLQNNVLVKDIQLVVDVLSAGVGIVVVGSLIVGGIQYSFAGDNPQATAAAKNRIINSLLALAAFALTFAFLQWIIPGGLFS